MGVSGSGKSTVGTRLARRLNAAFADGDDMHPQANLDKMRAGVALTDADREPWLRRCAAWLAERRAAGEDAVLACSALKRAYRDVLRAAAPDLRIVYLAGDRELLAARLSRRPGHFFNPRLLDSQLADAQPPGEDERAVVIAITLRPDEIVDRAAAALART
jgi:gluconokinase